MRVLVAMSGGVDSSVAAALLKEQGFEVIGATMQLWFDPKAEEEAKEKGKGCSSMAAVADARQVCNVLGIPHHVFNFRDLFNETVVSYFMREYKRGRTPNPCVVCNRYIKFAHFLRKAEALNCEYMATGHYARRVKDLLQELFLLKKARDQEKDQTYMLYCLTQHQLSKVLFPLGDLHKSEVRALAKKYGLPVSQKKESQDICFIPNNNYRDFISRMSYSPSREGPIIDLQGKKVGVHKGLEFYTIGQRKGLGLAFSEPVYVVDIIPERNTIKIGPAEALYSKGLELEDVNYITSPVTDATKIEVKIRYRSPLHKAILYP
ncbi:MAG: tRNA 2-thiouridine(34) synthase MnmA, partial [Firmicutes bacterium]|nr:tRNA 2-thiouridine(34) synthase MnmA [Bacillota bacterium]